MLFWLVVLSGKFAFAYFLQVSVTYIGYALVICRYIWNYTNMFMCVYDEDTYTSGELICLYVLTVVFLWFADKATGEPNKGYYKRE